MAKFGSLFLNKGNYKGKQVVDKEWMQEATSEQIKLKQPKNGYAGYGYFFWITSVNNHKVFASRGNNGQFIVCVPDL